MLTEDYIMRMISQAIAALMIALGLKKAGKYREALQSLDQAIEQLLGLHATLVDQLDDSALLEMLTRDGAPDLDRVMVLADIYRERAEVYLLQGQPDSSQFAAQRSLHLYLEAALAHEGLPEFELISKVEELRSKIDPPSLPLETRLALLDYLERLLDASDAYLASAGISRTHLMADRASLEDLELHQ